jgi:hypothetical protein
MIKFQCAIIHTKYYILFKYLNISLVYINYIKFKSLDFFSYNSLNIKTH